VPGAACVDHTDDVSLSLSTSVYYARTGVGLAVTQTLLDKNISKVYIISLDKNIADSAKDTLKKELGEEKASRLHWLKCDLADWDTVPGVAKQILGDIDRLDILVNNAARGIMTFQLTEPYGVDRHMAIVRFFSAYKLFFGFFR
jgi:NAD(P)-dependent dehydrogenase (short-subunit alcohol dehydrogenase family)